VSNLKMKILIVDDFSTMRRIIKNILKQLGYSNIIEADDGSSALTLLKKDKIDFIVSDWNMPKMSGLDLIKVIRSDEKLKSIPFLMVTAEAQKEQVMKALQEGVDNYIVKPFTAEILKEKIDKIFSN
jgi:two-component system chemotaxis response regulator CheY